MKINEVLNNIKVLLESGEEVLRTSMRHHLLFDDDVVFDGVSFIHSELEDSLCYDMYKNVLVYFPTMENHKCIIVPQHDKTEMFNFLVQYDLSTDNIDTFHKVLKMYKYRP